VDVPHLPEDADQDEVDAAVERLRSRMLAAAAEAGLTGVEVRVRTEIREGRVWVIGETTPKQPPP
jgi:hypothetical protein